MNNKIIIHNQLIYHIEWEYDGEYYDCPNVYVYTHIHGHINDHYINKCKDIYHKKLYNMNRIKSAKKVLVVE